MLKHTYILCFIAILLSFTANTQRYSFKKKFGTQKNGVYVYWGYNRSAFTKSDITFEGPDYNFTLKNVAAKDRPSNKLSHYFDPSKFTVPQFNVRVGWYYKFRWDISIGYDHMKYVVRNWQYLKINGVIEGVDTDNTLEGVHTNSDEEFLIRPDELHYENTNGLNYISFQLNNTAPLYKTNNRKFAIQRRLGGGIGPVLTQTDFTWDGTNYESDYNFAGYGISLHAGVRFDFFNHFFLQNNFAGGFIHLPKNRTIEGQDHFAKHKFVYGAWEIVGGFLFYLRTKNACDTCPDWH